MSAELPGQSQAGTSYDTAGSALRRRSVELVRDEQGADVRWIVKLQLAGNHHEVVFNGLKSRPSDLPASLRRHLAGLTGDAMLEPQHENDAPNVDDEGLHRRPGDAAAALTAMFRELSDQLLVRDLAVRLDVPDAVHQLRVTCRSFRALLTAAAPFLDVSQRKDLDLRLRDLARRCGPARDAEVTAELLPAGIELLREAVQPAALDLLQKRALEEFAGASREVRRHLQRSEHLQLLADVQAFASRPPLTDAVHGRSSRQLANRLLRRSLRKLQRIAARSPEAQDETGGEEAAFHHTHDVRKAVKRVRYVSSVLDAAEIRPRKKIRRAAEDARRYQRELGEIIDLAVLHDWLSRTAVELKREGDRYDVGLLQGVAISRFSDGLRRSEVLIDELLVQLAKDA